MTGSCVHLEDVARAARRGSRCCCCLAAPAAASVWSPGWRWRQGRHRRGHDL